MADSVVGGTSGLNVNKQGGDALAGSGAMSYAGGEAESSGGGSYSYWGGEGDGGGSASAGDMMGAGSIASSGGAGAFGGDGGTDQTSIGDITINT